MLSAKFDKEKSMNINANANAVQNTKDVVALTMLKKSIDTSAQNALALINAIPQSGPRLPPNLGKNINTTA